MCALIDSYLTRFSSLRGIPQEPLLLLSALDLVADRQVNRNFFDLSPLWEEKFLGYLQLFPDLSQEVALSAFHSLVESGFWHPVILPGGEPNSKARCDTFSEIRSIYLGIRVDDDLFPLLVMETSRKKLRAVLLESYFIPGVLA